MRDQLNGMKLLLEGGSEPFNENFYRELVSCYQELDGDALMTSQDAQWLGFTQYAASSAWRCLANM